MDDFKDYLIPIGLVLFLIYRRVKKTIGFQKYSLAKLIFRIVLFSLVSIFLLSLTAFNPISLISEITGISLGLGLVYLAIRNTTFETRTDGFYYRTSIWLELSILFIFFARLLYRFYKMYSAYNNMEALQKNPDQLQDIKNPYTAGIFFILCTYYICYFLFIIKRTQALKKIIISEVK